jgi:hypothetical protein
MKKAIIKLAAVLALVSPAALVADDEKETPEKTVEVYDNKTRGAIQVNGDTKDWFEVYRGEKAVAFPYPLLGKTAEVEPGEYEVQVNRSSRKVTVEAGKKVVLQTGTLELAGKDGLYWYPVVGGKRMVGTNRNPPSPGAKLALFPGTYAVDLNLNLRKVVRVTESAKVEVGKTTTVKQ